MVPGLVVCGQAFKYLAVVGEHVGVLKNSKCLGNYLRRCERSISCNCLVNTVLNTPKKIAWVVNVDKS